MLWSHDVKNIQGRRLGTEGVGGWVETRVREVEELVLPTTYKGVYRYP